MDNLFTACVTFIVSDHEHNFLFLAVAEQALEFQRVADKTMNIPINQKLVSIWVLHIFSFISNLENSKWVPYTIKGYPTLTFFRIVEIILKH